MKLYRPNRLFALLLILSGLALLVLTGFRDPSTALPEAAVSLPEVEAQIRFLASDELAGRAAGTPGNRAAARYIAESFRLAGLKPAPGSIDFLQRFELERVTPPADQGLSFAGSELTRGDDFILIAGDRAEISSEAVFVGFGLEEPGSSGARDLEGKVAVARFGDPEGSGGFRAIREKQAALSARGALAILELYSADQWQMFGRFAGRARTRLAGGGEAEEIPHLLIRDDTGEFLKASEAGAAPPVRISLSEVQREAVEAQNVAAVLEGSDPDLRKEWVALSAHYDHVGSGRELPGATDQDQIFNGARDNGMGTVALLTAARTLAERRPARSVLFLALDAEEIGLLGSRYYVEHPLVPLEQTVFLLNADGGGYEDTSLVTVLGLDRTSEGPVIRQACSEFGLEAIPGGEELQRFFNQSDNVNFARKGIPAPTFSPGFRVFGEAIRKFYHQPSDEPDENFDFEYLLRYSQSFALSARLIADGEETPHWAAGDEYEAARKPNRKQ